MGKHRRSGGGIGFSRLTGRFALVSLLPLAVALIVLAATLAITGRADKASLAAEHTRMSRHPGTTDVAGSTVVETGVAPAREVAAPVQLVVRRPQRPKRPKRIAMRTVQAAINVDVGTLNILGSNHAPNGLARAAAEAGLIRDRGIDIIGLQEVQRDQRPVFLRNMPGYAMWPQDALGRQGYRVQIMYRTDRFEKVDDGGVEHTFDSQRVPIPWIKLRDRETGGTFHVIASHNSPRGMQAQRVASTYIQSDLVNRLEATGSPVLLLGDFNEHQEYFCRISSRTRVRSANGGYYASGCVAPPRPIRIDWVLGSESVRFSGYQQDGATLARRLSDHYLIHATATISVPVEVPADGPAPASAGESRTPAR